MHRICSSLARHGWRVTLVGRLLPDSVPLHNYPFQTERLACFFRRGKLFYLEYNCRLFVKLLFTSADVFAAVDLDTIIPCFIVAALKGKKKMLDAHEYFQEVPEVTGRPFTKKIWELVGRWFIPRADVAITVSESLAEEFYRLYGKRFTVIRNVPLRDEAQEAATSGGEGRFMLYQGALNAGRGLEQLLLAMRHLDIPLKIAGEGDLSEQLRSQAKALGVDTKVEFLGKVAPDKLRALTRQAWLGLNLLENNSLSYYYSLANKFFDYLSCGVPSLTMNFPEYRRINNRYMVSLLLNEPTPEGIVQAVRQLESNPALYDKLQSNALLASKEYHWEKEEQKLLAVMEQV